MPYYSRSTEQICYLPGCNAKATEEVLTPFNDRMGYYCKKHAKERVNELNEATR